MQLWEIADEVDSDFALQAVGGDVRAGGIALLTVKDVKDDNSEEEAEEIYTDTRDTQWPQFGRASCSSRSHS